MLGAEALGVLREVLAAMAIAPVAYATEKGIEKIDNHLSDADPKTSNDALNVVGSIGCVPAGVVEIVEKERQSWATLRP